MIYFVYGNKTEESLNKFKEIANSFKEGNLSVFRFDDDTFELDEFKNVFKTDGLFGQKCLVLLKRVFNNSIAKEYILENLEALNNSENIFVFLEEKIKPTDLKEVQKCAKNIFEYSVDKRAERKKELAIYF